MYICEWMYVFEEICIYMGECVCVQLNYLDVGVHQCVCVSGCEQVCVCAFVS